MANVVVMEHRLEAAASVDNPPPLKTSSSEYLFFLNSQQARPIV
jgi:hypothetical protein